MRKKILTIATSLFISTSHLQASGNGTSAGLTLVGPAGARSAALGEAFTAVADDITSFHYNPASLATLSSGQSSFLFQKGLAQDTLGRFFIGSPIKKGALGLSIGYYNGGDFDLVETNGNERTVTAKRDLVASVGYSTKVGQTSLGVAGKYFSSELVETEKATAFAADVGLQIPMGSRINLGVAVQNIGSQLKFGDQGHNLPQIARAGLSIGLLQGNFPLQLLLDAPYYKNESELRPAIGLEMSTGPLALRTGYKSKNNQQSFSFGAGFQFKKMSFDYSYGLAEDLNASHHASVSLRFGGSTPPVQS